MRFRFRLIITVALLIALSFGVGGAVLIGSSFRASLNEETERALASFESARRTLYLLNSLGEQTQVESLSRALSQIVGPWKAVRLRNEEGVLSQSGADVYFSAQLQSPGDNRCVYTAVCDEKGWGLQVLGGLSAGNEKLYLEARFDLSAVYASRQTQLRLFLVIYISVVILGIAAAGALGVLLTGRLSKLTRAVRRISGGDLSTRSNIRTGDEFGQLSRDFDAMADKLQDNITALEADMQRQEAFMGAFAHELKTPMTAIIGYADLLRQGGLDETTRFMAANYIYSEGRRLEKLSFKLLDLLLLQKEKLSMREVDIPAFLVEVEKALAPILRGKDIRLVCRGERGKAVLEPDLVKSLLYNLIDNAAKAIDKDGIVAVKAVPFSGGCEFHVADNGRGMEPQELSRITEAFYRVDKSRSRKQGGAGLGLALCKQIVALHNGTMKFSSTPGSGTRVYVVLYEGRERDP